MYKQDVKLFEFTAKQWTENYAKEVDTEAKIKTLMEMGFDKDLCKEALERYDYDEQMALNFLLGGWKNWISWLYVPSLLTNRSIERDDPSIFCSQTVFAHIITT